jgi:enamine deaminase RidA (YjgF/YER057c/UK114 family)
VFVAGQIGLDPWSMQFVEGGWEEQFAESVRHVESVLKVMKSDLKSSLIVSVWMEASIWSDETVEEVRHSLGPRINGDALFLINPAMMLPRAALVEVCVVARSPSELKPEWNTWKGDCHAMNIPSGQASLVLGTKECAEYVRSSDCVFEYLPRQDSVPSSSVLALVRMSE